MARPDVRLVWAPKGQKSIELGAGWISEWGSINLRVNEKSEGGEYPKLGLRDLVRRLDSGEEGALRIYAVGHDNKISVQDFGSGDDDAPF
jgi:hypothetical protein